MEYQTLPNVELVTVGMKWKANVPTTLTLEHLADMVKAANEDPHIQVPRVKIGHTDPRFDDGVEDHNAFYDGEPVYGIAENLRLENDGAVVVCDLIEVPAWLADAAPSAYPSRSCEWIWDVETPGGKRYSAVLTAVSLLGEEFPAIQDLEDLQRVLTEGEDVSQVTEGDLAAAKIRAASGVQAAADVDKVIQTFWAGFATEEDDRYWWWPRSVWTDPNELIADDDEGNLWRVPFSSDAGQNVTFSEPTQVKQTFVDARTGDRVAAVKRDSSPEQIFASRKDAGRDKTRPAASRPEGEDPMDAVVRELLGLAEDATEEEVIAKLDELNGDRAEGAEEEAPHPTDEPKLEENDETPAEEPEPIAASADEVTVTVDKGVWEETQRQAREGAAARSEQVNEARERLLDNAVKAGKIAPSSKDAWRTKHQAAASATEAELEALPAGLIPTNREEVGVAATDADKATLETIRQFRGIGSGAGKD